jgi:hypothetical protein
MKRRIVIVGGVVGLIIGLVLARMYLGTLSATGWGNLGAMAIVAIPVYLVAGAIAAVLGACVGNIVALIQGGGRKG